MTLSHQAQLEELAERCEKATGPDAELSKDIHEAIGNCVHRETRWYCIEDGNDYDSGFTCVACKRDTYGTSVPAYTSSLDAAMTLVPQRWAVEMSGWHSLSPGEPRASFDLWEYRWGDDGQWWHGSKQGQAIGRARFPALALTAACLRAISKATGEA